ncbi:MAG: hypothetical protein ACR2L4_01540 [Actinomycetota bacterium]
MNTETEQVGSFRTRVADDGSLEVWARGWRLESQLYALIPMGLALMFLLAPMSTPMRAAGALVMLGATLSVFRMTKPGLLLTREAVSIVSVIRTKRFGWDRVSGFMGERSHNEARILLVLQDEQRITLPGTLDPAELDPYGDEGQELSAADQLNRLQELAIGGDLPKPAAPVRPAADLGSGQPTRKEQRSERKELRQTSKAVRLTPEGTPELERISALQAPDQLPEGATRKEQRGERKALRAALKAVRLTPEGTVVQEAPDAEPTRTRRSGQRSRRDPTPELVEVPIGDPETSAGPPARTKPEPPPLNSNYPTPVYIPQAEYAQMLREQKAAEKAAVAAAAELRRLAEVEEPDELAVKEEFSDWASERSRSAG